MNNSTQTQNSEILGILKKNFSRVEKSHDNTFVCYNQGKKVCVFGLKKIENGYQGFCDKYENNKITSTFHGIFDNNIQEVKAILQVDKNQPSNYFDTPKKVNLFSAKEIQTEGKESPKKESEVKLKLTSSVINKIVKSGKNIEI